MKTKVSVKVLSVFVVVLCSMLLVVGGAFASAPEIVLGAPLAITPIPTPAAPFVNMSETIGESWSVMFMVASLLGIPTLLVFFIGWKYALKGFAFIRAQLAGRR